jgi:hypothetical protein
LKFFRLAAAKLRLAALSRDPFYLLANKGRFTRHVIIDQTKFDGELISAFFPPGQLIDIHFKDLAQR